MDFDMIVEYCGKYSTWNAQIKKKSTNKYNKQAYNFFQCHSDFCCEHKLKC